MFYNFMSRYGQFLALGLGALITIIFFAIVGANGGTFAELEGKELTRIQYNEALSATSIFDAGLYGTTLLIVLCTLAVIAFSIYGLVTHPKQAIKTLIGIGVVAVIFIIGYTMANPNDVQEVITKINDGVDESSIDFVTNAKSSYVSGGLTTMFVFIAGSFLALLGFEAWNLFR